MANQHWGKQRGFTFWGFVFTVGPIIVVALLAMLLFPAYSEFFAIKKAVQRIGTDPSFGNMTDGDVRAMMDRSIEIDNIHSIKSSDLVIQRGETGSSVSVDYEVVVPLVANVSALLEFNATTDNKNSVAN